MSKEVIGTSPSTGEVLVRDTDTGDMSWEPGTEEQVDRVTRSIEATPEYTTPTYEEYQEPEEEYVPPAPPPPPPTLTYTYREVPPEALVEAPEAVSALSVSVDFIGWIIERFNWLSEYFYDIYLEVLSWVWPFYNAAYLFLFLSEVSSQLAWDFYDFSLWIVEVHDRVAQVLSWSTIWSYILSYVPNLEEIRDWFYHWWSNVYGVVTDWWSSTSTTVLGWIDETKQWAQLWIDYLQGQVNALGVRIDDVLALIPDVSDIQAWFANWTGNVSSVITTWWTGALSQVQSLIDSAFIEREPFWAGWQDWRDRVTEFFTDPEKWVYDRLDSFFERYW